MQYKALTTIILMTLLLPITHANPMNPSMILVGRVAPKNSQMLSAPQDGIIHSINFKNTQSVQKNDVLITMENSSDKKELIDSLTRCIQIQDDLKKVNSEYSLNQKLYECGDVSKNHLDESKTKIHLKKIEWITAKNHLLNKLKVFDLSWGEIEPILKGNAEMFSIFIEKPYYQHLHAPQSGMAELASNSFQIGQHIKQGTPLLKVYDTKVFQIKIELPDSIKDHFKANQHIQVKNHHHPDIIYNAKVHDVQFIKKEFKKYYEMTVHIQHNNKTLTTGSIVQIPIYDPKKLPKAQLNASNTPSQGDFIDDHKS